MIALLRGTILHKYQDYIIIDVSGIGYRVFMAGSSLNTITTGENQEIFTHLHIREDAMLLYGFLSETEKGIFTKLLAISGLGPKTALAVTSYLPPDAFIKAVQQGDTDTFAKVPGIGKKTAQRIILELKGKIDFDETEIPLNAKDDTFLLVSEALAGLGYSRSDIRNVLMRVDLKAASPEEIIRQALRILAKV